MVMCLGTVTKVILTLISVDRPHGYEGLRWEYSGRSITG